MALKLFVRKQHLDQVDSNIHRANDTYHSLLTSLQVYDALFQQLQLPLENYSKGPNSSSVQTAFHQNVVRKLENRFQTLQLIIITNWIFVKFTETLQTHDPESCLTKCLRNYTNNSR